MQPQPNDTRVIIAAQSWYGSRPASPTSRNLGTGLPDCPPRPAEIRELADDDAELVALSAAVPDRRPRSPTIPTRAQGLDRSHRAGAPRS